jgi:5-methyltetrahydropteroyltriglutamate--homocysteine methyltransferase
MKRSTDRILTTHTGSLPRPKDLAGMLFAGAQTSPDQGAFAMRAARAVHEAVAKQVLAGVDVVSDGEQSKIGFVNYVKDRLTGFEGKSKSFLPADLLEFPGLGASLQATTVSAGNVQPNFSPACTGPIVYRDRDAYRKDIANLKAALVGQNVQEAFMCAIAPGTVAQVIDNEYYKTRREYLFAIGDAIKEEYTAITDAGFVLQVDACDLAMDRHVNFKSASIREFRDVIVGNVEALNRATEGIPREQIRVHLCWGNYPGPHNHDVALKDIIDIVLTVRAGAVSFEAANPRHEHEWRVWRNVDLPPDLILIPGVIDTNSPYIEHPEVVADRIENFASVVGRARVVAGTDCGFGTFVFLSVPEELAYAKLKALSEGAAIASRRLY